METRREIKQAVIQSLAAALLALRMLYDEQLLEKKVDASGRISVKLTELVMFMNTTFGVSLPPTKTDQRALFMKLKKHGAIDVRIDALADEDAVIVIRPEILTLVLEQNVRAAHAAFVASQGTEALEENGSAPSAEAAEPEAKGAQIIPLDRAERNPAHRA